MEIALKRIYDPPAPDDGLRVLVDRLWPRGVSKERAALDLWLRDVAPSNELRKWFHHEAPRWEEFRRRYDAEIAVEPAAFERLGELAREGRLTLLFASAELERNHAAHLRDRLLAEDRG